MPQSFLAIELNSDDPGRSCQEIRQQTNVCLAKHFATFISRTGKKFGESAKNDFLRQFGAFLLATSEQKNLSAENMIP